MEQAALTVVANNASKVYGAPNPAFTGMVTGAVNNDSFIETFSTAATQTSNAGTYTIVPAVTGTDLSDYMVTATNGTLTVTKAATATTLSASANSITQGQSLTLTAQVMNASAGSTGTPTGTVSFYDGTTLLGASTLTNSTASYTTATLAPGATHALSATYSGDANFTGSASSSAVSVPVAASGLLTAGRRHAESDRHSGRNGQLQLPDQPDLCDVSGKRDLHGIRPACGRDGHLLACDNCRQRRDADGDRNHPDGGAV